MLKPPSIADLISRIEADSDLSPSKRRNLASSVRMFAKVLDLDLAHDRPGIRPYRDKLASFEPARAGMSRKRWSNIRSDYRFVLERYDFLERRPRPADLDAEWRRVRDLVQQTDLRLVRGLSSFIHFCNRAGIAPDEVSDAASAAFHEYLLTETTTKRPNRVHRRVCVLWNRASATILAWPKIELSVPSYVNHFSFAISEFPAPFQLELQRWLNRLASTDVFDEDALDHPCRPATLRTKREQVRRFASALALSGTNIATITSLAQLVEWPNFQSAVTYLYERAGNEKNGALYEQVATLVGMAKKWVRLPPDELSRLQGTLRYLKCRKRGMTDKNRERIRAFDDPHTDLKQKELPKILLSRARKMKKARKAALLVQSAVAIGLQTVVPIRLHNLLTLRIARHFDFSRAGRGGVVHLILPAEEVKNGETYEAELAGDMANLLKLYIDKYLPILANGSVDWLFPGAKGGHKHASTLSGKIKEINLRELGVPLHTHGHRHLAVKRSLDVEPGNYATPSDLLGHKSIQSTADFYAGFRSKRAVRHFDEKVLNAKPKGRPKGGK